MSGKVKGPNGKQKGQNSNSITMDLMFQKMENDLVSLKKHLSHITIQNSSRKPNPLDRPRITRPPRQLYLESPPVNAICDTKELEEELEIDETEEENMEDYENYLEVEEVDMHNGLIEYINDED